MRYYAIVVQDANSGSTVAQWSSQNAGAFDPGAQQVQFDIPVAPYAQPLGLAAIKIWGPRLQHIAQSSDFNGMNLTLYGGMTTGLPLANPQQQGELIRGTIWQAYGNWIGTEMTLDFIISPSGVSNDKPGNISFHWKAGTSLSSAIAQTLSTAFPTLKQSININPNIVLAHDEAGYWLTLEGFAAFLESVTVGLFGSTYDGVQVALQQGTFAVYDGSSPASPIALSFTDLVGQPTWIGTNQCQVTTVMRGDIQVGNSITLPQGFVPGAGSVTVLPSSMSQYASQSAFQGTMLVTAIRHVGSFRDPDGRAWVSIFNCTFP